MKSFLCVVFAAAAFGSEVSIDEQYSELHNIIAPAEDAMDSVALAELRVHVGIKNPMTTIYETCMQMRTDILSDRKVAMKREISDVKLCKSTIADYSAFITAKTEKAQHELAKQIKMYNAHTALKAKPNSLNNTRALNNVTIASEEVTVARGQANRDANRSEFEKLQIAFEMALGNISLIGRVLNGEGTLGDLHGKGFLEEASCSARMSKLAEDSDTYVPQVASMLQVFSKAFSKVEHKTTGDMDAINTILAKVRENLLKSLKLATEQENLAISNWKTSKRSQRNTINVNWETNAANFKEQGEVESKIGSYWEREGGHKITIAQEEKARRETEILRAFLTKRCDASRNAHARDLANKANELNALDRVIRYLRIHVKGKWSKEIVDVVSAPYSWKLEESPTYVAVSGGKTYSTAAHAGQDSESCQTCFSTVFTKLRVLTSTNGNQKFLDPNDLTHSTNKDCKYRKQTITNIDCQVFPTGIPVGRAHSCSETGYANAVIDLTGTPYKFGKAALRMFKVLGRKTSGSKASLSANGKVLSLQVRGRCGDLYGDDAASENVDYRSDPIPLEM